jgi:hypothetical protein
VNGSLLAKDISAVQHLQQACCRKLEVARTVSQSMVQSPLLNGSQSHTAIAVFV